MSKQYPIGKGKPPVHSQFKPGQSGNPAGRKPGAKGLKTYLSKELKEKIVVTENGVVKRISKQEAILKALTTNAAKGDMRAIERIFELIIQVLGTEDAGSSEKAALSANDQALLDAILADMPASPPEANDGDGGPSADEPENYTDDGGNNDEDSKDENS